MRTGRELVEILRAAGWVESRRSRSVVWLKRDDQRLMVDEDAPIDDAEFEQVIREATGRAPR